MKIITSIAGLAACLALVFAMAIPAMSSPSAPLTGTWACTSQGGKNGPMNFTLDLEQHGRNVTGYVHSPLGDASLSSGTFKRDHLTITIDGDNDQYTLSADLKNGHLSGKWSTSNSGHHGTWTGKKSTAKGQ